MSSSESEDNYEYNMTMIKKFYTQLGQIIEIAEYNDPEELDFLCNYIEKYDEEYDKWYNYEESTEELKSEKSESEDEENTSSVEKKENKSFIPEHVNEFMSNEFDLSNILLYNNKDNYKTRTQTYNQQILHY